MNLQQMNNPRPGQMVQCVKCHKMIDGDKALADLDDKAGTFYHPECAALIACKAFVRDRTTCPTTKGKDLEAWEAMKAAIAKAE